MTIDDSLITQAILDTECSPLALEQGSELVQHWIEKNEEDRQWKIMAVETGFVCWLNQNTVVIGVQDLLTEEDKAVRGSEWKTTGARAESDWLDDILAGSQIGIYALALNKGTYYEKGSVTPIVPAVSTPSIRVRAIKKSVPPIIWPKKAENGIITFGPERLGYIENALKVKADSIRAMRKAGVVPWQLPGLWCTNKYKRTCVHYADCTNQRTPSGSAIFDINDPAYKLALPFIGDRVEDPELVVLGASAYAAYSECAENGRRNTLVGNREDSLALQIGSVFHAGVAEFYRQIKENQQKKIDKVLEII